MVIGPGASNGLQIFGGANTVTVPIGGVEILGYNPAGTGLPVSGSAKTIAVNNPGETTATCTIAIAVAVTIEELARAVKRRLVVPVLTKQAAARKRALPENQKPSWAPDLDKQRANRFQDLPTLSKDKDNSKKEN